MSFSGWQQGWAAALPLFFADGLAHCRGRGGNRSLHFRISAAIHVVVWCDHRCPWPRHKCIGSFHCRTGRGLPRPVLRALEAGRVEEVAQTSLQSFPELGLPTVPLGRTCFEREFARLDLPGRARDRRWHSLFRPCAVPLIAPVGLAAWLRGRGVGLVVVWGVVLGGWRSWVEERSDGDHRSAGSS